MDYVRCECESCKQGIVLPGEVLNRECFCPGCGKPVAIPVHESAPFVHHMRAKLLATVAVVAVLWVAAAVAMSLLSRRDNPTPAPGSFTPRPSPAPVQALTSPVMPAVPAKAAEPSEHGESADKATVAWPAIQNSTATTVKEPNAG